MPSSLPPCYALVHPGLESVASDEIENDLGGEVKRTGRGVVVFRLRPDEADLPSVLSLRTVEDVFLFAWGTDTLTRRALDLDKIRQWTAREPDWKHLLALHHMVRPKPRGRPTFHLVTQMEGQRGYRRADAGKAFALGLAGKFPPSWKPVEENASVEFWLTIEGSQAVCGIRLSDASMRHRTYKLEHRPASLRPTLAASMVRLADLHPGQVVLDPMCGVGTLLCESALFFQDRNSGGDVFLCGGDSEFAAARDTAANLRRLGQGRPNVVQWDARLLPLPTHSVDRILCNPPFGKQLGQDMDLGALYRQMGRECDRVLRPGGRAVLVVGDGALVQQALDPLGWNQLRQLAVRILGQPTVVSVWNKPTR